METEIKGSVKIGRNGTKFHPATKTINSDGKSFFWIHCSCAGTRQGGAHKNSTFFANQQSNCKS